jgi:hypothetical protein
VKESSVVPNPVVKRASAALEGLLGRHKARRVAAVLDEQRLLAAPVEREGSPFAISIRRTGLGVELDHHDLVAALLSQLAKDYSEDSDGVGSQLQELAYAEGGERDSLMETLVERLGDATQLLGARQALRLADRLRAAVAPFIPNQQDRSAA